MKKISSKIFLSSLGLVLLLSACKRDYNDRGLEYAPQMYVAKSYEPYSQTEGNKINPLGINMRTPAEGTIPRRRFNTEFTIEDSTGSAKKMVELMVYNHVASDDFETAAKVLKNPYPADEEVLAEGKVLYTRICTPCHGAEGDGKGTVAEMYKGVANLKGSAYTNLPAGHIYHVITHGKGRMWPHGSQLTPDERWKIVHYVFQLQGRTSAPQATDASATPKADSTVAQK
ncbi:MAG: cytochrome c [Microscillaceae bacterium]|nr:cytochrome c [Microscillaceae bacterium]